MTMYTDRNAMVEYEYDGTFYKKEYGVPEDGDLLSDARDDETVILSTKCDIQKTDKLFTSGVVSMGYSIYFPMPQTEEGEERLPEGMKVGIRFRGEMYGMPVEGMVIGIEPTKLHGCVAYIKGTDI